MNKHQSDGNTIVNLTKMVNANKQRNNITWLELFDPPLCEDPIELRIAIIVIMGLIFIVGFVGNLCSSIVILKHRSLHTVINLYLLNLAASDLFLLIWIFLDMYFFWDPTAYPLGHIGCKIHFFIIVFLFGNGNLTVTALAVERYFAICHPLVLRRKGKSRVLTIVVCVWTVSALCATFDALDVGLKSTDHKVLCVTIPSESTRVTNGVLSVLMYFIPLVTVVTMYTMIVVKLNKKGRSEDKTFNGRSSRKRATWTLVALTIFIFICWTPFVGIRLLLVLTNYTKDRYGTALRVAFYMWCVNCWLSTAINPIIFSVMSKKFRTAFKTLLKRRRMSIQTSRYMDSTNYRSKMISYNQNNENVDTV